MEDRWRMRVLLDATPEGLRALESRLGRTRWSLPLACAAATVFGVAALGLVIAAGRDFVGFATTLWFFGVTMVWAASDERSKARYRLAAAKEIHALASAAPEASPPALLITKA